MKRIGQTLGLVLAGVVFATHSQGREPEGPSIRDLAGMEVVEPRLEGHFSPPVGTSRHDLPMGAARLTREEEAQAVDLRMATQKALRSLKAQRMALHRKQGRRSWRRDLETFLTNQRELKSKAGRLNPSPRVRPYLRPQFPAPLRPEDSPDYRPGSPKSVPPLDPREWRMPEGEEPRPNPRSNNRSNAVLA